MNAVLISVVTKVFSAQFCSDLDLILPKTIIKYHLDFPNNRKNVYGFLFLFVFAHNAFE